MGWKGLWLAILKKIAALAFASFVLGAMTDAYAQSIGTHVNLVSGQTVTYDGLSFKISACTFSSNGSTATNCSTSGTGQTNDYLEIVASNRGTPTIEIIGNGSGNAGGTAVAKGSAALACNKCTAASTLDVTIQVKRASGTASTVTSFSNAITGNTASSGITSAAYYPNTTLLSTENASTNLASGPIAIANGLSNTSSVMTFKVDLGLAAFTTGALALNTNRLNFSPAPEPAAIALFCVGLVGLTAARHRFTRKRAGIAA